MLLRGRYKMDVYAMAEHFNQRAIAEGRTGPVSASTLTKPLPLNSPDQIDQDTLSREVLDAVLQGHIEGGLNADDLIERGLNLDGHGCASSFGTQ